MAGSAEQFELAIIGAGPAGAAAAITGARRGARVVLLEAGAYPRHKVCGEFVSAESAAVLEALLADGTLLRDAPRLPRCTLHAGRSKVAFAITPAAYSIPRFDLDAALWKAAETAGVRCLRARVERIAGNTLEVQDGSVLCAATVINATGRWSKLSQRTSPRARIGIKAHFTGTCDDAVHLFFGRGLYCGVQPLMNGLVNVCALADPTVARSLPEVFRRFPALAEMAEGWRQVTETFATAPVHLLPPEPLRDGVLCAGDAAGFVDPFVGDGISLALRGGVLAGQMFDRPADYALAYRGEFAHVFRNAARLRRLLTAGARLLPAALPALRIPYLGPALVRATRAGNPR